jgi:IclR family transcriptional regulator, acetate operon repressor
MIGSSSHIAEQGEDNVERTEIQSVARALSLLDALARAGGESTLSVLAAEAGLNISTCHHLMATMMRRGYVAQGAGKRAYRIGTQVLRLSQVCLRQVDLPQRAEAQLDRINVTTGETVHLAVILGDAIVTVAKRDSRHAVRVDTGPLGATEAAHATACGKAILAWLTEDTIRRIVAGRKIPGFTQNTITRMDALLEELRLVRRNGYATDREEYQPGVICIGAPIRDYTGAVVGSLSASAPLMRATDQHLDVIRQEIVSATTMLSRELGEDRSPPSANKSGAIVRRGQAKSASKRRGGK